MPTVQFPISSRLRTRADLQDCNLIYNSHCTQRPLYVQNFSITSCAFASNNQQLVYFTIFNLQSSLIFINFQTMLQKPQGSSLFNNSPCTIKKSLFEFALSLDQPFAFLTYESPNILIPNFAFYFASKMVCHRDFCRVSADLGFSITSVSTAQIDSLVTVFLFKF